MNVGATEYVMNVGAIELAKELRLTNRSQDILVLPTLIEVESSSFIVNINGIKE